MINNIINIIESHCIESKSSKRLFAAIPKCSNFLQALKMVDTFAAGEKILVPTKFSFMTFPPKETKPIQLDTSFNGKQRDVSTRKKKETHDLTSRSISPLNKEVKKTENKEKNQVNFLIPPPKIQRFKSEGKMKKFYEMKASAGETACSINHKELKTSNQCLNRTLIQDPTYSSDLNKSYQSEFKNFKSWIDESMFLES